VGIGVVVGIGGSVGDSDKEGRITKSEGIGETILPEHEAFSSAHAVEASTKTNPTTSIINAPAM